MTNAQQVSYQSLQRLAHFTSPRVGKPEPLYPDLPDDVQIVKVEWGQDTFKFLLEPGGCIAQVYG